LLSLFRTGEVVAGRVRFVGPSVTVVRLEDGRIRLVGLQDRPASETQFDLDRLPAGIVEIVEASVLFRDLKSGRGPWRLDALNLTLERHHNWVAVSGNTRLPESLGTEVRFEGRLDGSLRRLEDLNARLDISAAQLKLVGLADFLPDTFAQPLAGHGPATAALALDQGRLRLARLDLDVADVVLQLPSREPAPIATVQTSAPYREPGSKPLSSSTMDLTIVDLPAPALPKQVRFNRLAGRFRLRQEDGAWSFAARDLVTATKRAPAAVANLQGRFRGHPRTTYELQLFASDLKLEPAWPLVLAFAPASLDRWSGLDPRGEIVSLSARVIRERAGAPPSFLVSAELEGIGVKPTGRLPGLSGISATLSGTDQQGTVALRAQNAAFSFPRMFREPLEVDSASTRVDWHRDGRAWVLGTTRFDLAGAAGSARGSLEFQFERAGVSPLLTLDAEVDEADLSAVRGFLPIGRLQPRTVLWLENAFPEGRARGGRVSYKGPVRNFPFDQDEGDFRASLEVQDATLNFYEGFPPLTGASGTVEFHNESTHAQLRVGRLGGLRLTRGECTIADYRAPVIEVDAVGSGDLDRALGALQGSPLGPQLGSQFMGLSGHGPADYELRLRIATRRVGEPYYRVRARLNGATINVPLLRVPLAKVAGLFEIENLAVRAPSLTGELLGGPFEVTIEPGRLADGVTAAVDLHGRGRASGAQLPDLIGLPEGVRMAGMTDWTLQGHLERRLKGQHWPTQFEFRSDLAGLAVNAPRPLGKKPQESRPTSVGLQVPADGRVEVQLATGSARAALRFTRNAGGTWNLERGAARFDAAPVTLPARPGLQVAGNWPDFELSEWLALRSAKTGQRRLADWLGNVDVHLDRAQVLGFEFKDVGLKLSPAAAGWEAYVTGPMADGRITIPDDLAGGFPIVLEMGRLELRSPATDGTARSGEDPDPRDLPSLLVRAQEFQWEARRFGWLQADVVKIPEGLKLSRLSTRSEHFSLHGSGSWTADDQGSGTRLRLEFKSDNLADASRALDYRDAIEAEKASAVAELSWRGGPSRDVLARMNGKLRLEVDRGQITTVEPGAGRVLGLMSVAALPRRLSLDFRDVTDEGLAFDKVRGDFDIRAGSAYTDNLLLKGPAVDIGIAGRIGIANQDYDQTMVVSGNPTGPLAVAGALAAGPVIGAGVLVLSQLFKGQLQGLTRAYYRVTGSWADPRVQRISASAQPGVAAPGLQGVQAPEPVPGEAADDTEVGP
jgi:uncharacterized protein (TIGR02099 family)